MLVLMIINQSKGETMNIAQNVRRTILDNGMNCFSLYAGYGQTDKGHTIRFNQGIELTKRVDSSGRTKMVRYQYADNSRLTYRHSDNNGFSLITENSHNVKG